MGLQIATFVFGFALTTTVLGDYGCPPDEPGHVYYKAFGEKCYQFHVSKVSYAEAGGHCRYLGGLLAQPKSKDINDFLATAMGNVPKIRKRAWIGLSDKDKDGVYVWADGTTLSYPDDFNSFGHGQGPKHDGFKGDRVALDPSGLWYDYPVERKADVKNKHFICEVKVETNTQATKPSTTRSTKSTTATTILPKTITTPIATSTTTTTTTQTATTATTTPPTTTTTTTTTTPTTKTTSPATITPSTEPTTTTTTITTPTTTTTTTTADTPTTTTTATTTTTTTPTMLTTTTTTPSTTESTTPVSASITTPTIPFDTTIQSTAQTCAPPSTNYHITYNTVYNTNFYTANNESVDANFDSHAYNTTNSTTTHDTSYTASDRTKYHTTYNTIYNTNLYTDYDANQQRPTASAKCVPLSVQCPTKHCGLDGYDVHAETGCHICVCNRQ